MEFILEIILNIWAKKIYYKILQKLCSFNSLELFSNQKCKYSVKKSKLLNEIYTCSLKFPRRE